MTTLPRYPVFVPSKGRASIAPGTSTIERLVRSGVPVRVVVEESDVDAYARRWPEAELLVLPFSDAGLFAARNWIKDRSTAAGDDRHWQLDDNIIEFRRLYRGRRIPVHPAIALRVCEDFTDRYDNVAISGLNYQMFVPDETARPFILNCHVYSCCLFDNRLGFRWRSRYNDDTDLCLQVLSAGYCTVALNAFMANKEQTMVVGGGNTADLYQGDGRLRMARALERLWPYVVDTKRRFGRPQHVVRGAWRAFDTPLRRRTDVDFDALDAVDEYGMELRQVAPIRSPLVANVVAAWTSDGGQVRSTDQWASG